jgi:hypothetical protein
MPGWVTLVQAARADVLALEDAARAHQRLQDRAAIGKIILVP